MTPHPLRELYARARRHWMMAALAAVAACLIFTGLGRDYLWEDEGDTAVLAHSIAEFGVPTAWDGVTFSDSDYGDRLTTNFVMVSHPWLQYYATAAAFALAGESAFSARLPFAIAGLLTIVIVYVTVLKLSGRIPSAVVAAALLTMSVQFLIYSRQSRQYSLNAALTCLLILQFTRLRSWTQTLFFAAVAILLFHTHPGGVAPVAALALLTLVHRPFVELRPWFWRAVPIITVFTLPWLLLARTGYTHNSTPLVNAADLGLRLAQFGVECLSVTPLIGALALYVVARRTRQTPASLGTRDKTASTTGPAATRQAVRSFVLIVLTTIAVYAVVMAVTQSRETIWVVGMRGTPAVIPFAVMLVVFAIDAAARNSQKVWLGLVIVAGLTRLSDITPWTSGATPVVSLNPLAIVTFHTPTKAVDRVLHTELIPYVSSLVTPDPGTIARVSEFLRERAKADDIVITNYEWEPLYFHTRLPQGMKILPSYPIYQAARDHQLPSYVFGSDGVRWIVWRRTWGAYRGQECDVLLKALIDANVHVELVASMAETTWENRENIHFRRFPHGRHLYAWFQNVPETLVYRVDWPPGMRTLSAR